MQTASTDPLEHKSQKEKEKDHERKYNFRIALLQGILIRISFAFADGSTVLSTFIHTLTRNNVLVGLTGSIMTAGWMWPQLLISNVIEHRPRKLPFYILGMSGRTIGWIGIVLSTILIGARNNNLLAFNFLFFYFLAASSMGVSTIPYMDIISKTIEPRRRAWFFSLRQFIGLFFQFFIGLFFIEYILSDKSGLAFPYNYAVLFGCTWVAVIGAFLAFVRIREPIRPVQSERRPISQHLKVGPHFLKTDVHYRRFILFRILGHFAGMASPFYAPYALLKFSVPQSTAGLFAATLAVAGLVSNIAWGFVSKRYGTIWILRITAGLFWVPPFVAIAAGFLPQAVQIPCYFFVFVVSGVTMSGSMVGFMTYLLNIAPSMSRSTYIGFMNTMLFPVSFVSVLGGALVPLIHHEGVFAISVGMGVLTFFVTMRLEEVIRSDDDVGREV